MRISKRGQSSCSFGFDVTEKFLARHGFTFLIRSHEYHREGYFFCHNNTCLTVFSAPNYCGIGNKGIVLKIKSDLSYEIVPIITPDGSIVTASMYLERTKERSPTLNFEDIEEIQENQENQGNEENEKIVIYWPPFDITTGSFTQYDNEDDSET